MKETNHNNFVFKTPDWRQVIKKNNRRTLFVILSFIFIYMAIGFLIDLFLGTGKYPNASLSEISHALLTFQIIPKATFITGIIAVISLLFTFAFHDRLMLLGSDYQEITPETTQNLTETQLYNVVEEMKVAAGLRYMPKVYILNAEYMNAFASGYSEKSAMVVITRGLLEKLNRSELQAVMAHELSHIRHSDIKLTLMAAVLSNLTLILMDVLFFSAIFSGRDSENGEGRGRNQLFIIILILRYVLPLITVLLILYLSRTREYMADAGCVELMRDNEPLAKALLKIQEDHLNNQEQYQAAYSNTPHESIRREAYIFDPAIAGIQVNQSPSDLFSTHPSLEKRLKALGFIKND